MLFALAACSPLLSASPMVEDIHSYYKKENLSLIGGGALIAALIANSPLDQKIYDSYQGNCKSKPLENLLTFPRLLGGPQAVYIYSGVGAFGLLTKGTNFGNFTDTLFRRSFRSFIVGTIPLHVVRTLVGGRRPKDTRRSSHWKPFTKPHGASGDTYTGAILFINWANMVENKSLKTLLYTASFFSGIGRINDRFHYPSQVLLGWTMAYAACNAICQTNSKFDLSYSPNTVAIGFEF